MKQFLVLCAALALFAPRAFAQTTASCYWGWIDDSDKNPEDDWGTTCADYDGNPTGANAGCSSVAACTGTAPGCYKVRYSGNGEIVSLYGCMDEITDFNTAVLPQDLLALNLTPADMGFSDMPTEDEECESNDDALTDVITAVPPFTTLIEESGDEVEANFCVCTGTNCNGAERTAAAFAALLAVAVAMAF